jgi:hypothetical protein
MVKRKKVKKRSYVERPRREPGGSSKYRRQLMRKSRAELAALLIAQDAGIIKLRQMAGRMAATVGRLEAAPLIVIQAPPAAWQKLVAG